MRREHNSRLYSLEESPREDNKLSEQESWKPSWRQYVAVGCMALTTAVGSWKYLESRSGEYQYFPAATPVPVEIDDIHRVGSWNMHDEAIEHHEELKALFERFKLDAVTLQEVSADDAQSLSIMFPEWQLVYVRADAKQGFLDGGYGNLIMIRQEPRDIKAKSLAGTTLVETTLRTASAAGSNLINLVSRGDVSIEDAKDAMQENRAAVAVTVKIRVDDELKDVRIITSHISGFEIVHEKQLNELMEFIKDNTKEGRPTIFCGDLNAPKKDIIPEFAKIGFITPEDKRGRGTSVKTGRTIDYCSYYEADTLGLGHVRVLKRPSIDHYPIIATWKPEG